MRAPSPRTATTWAWRSTRDFILGLPGETKESIRNTINFAKTLDCETIQVSIAHAYPGTEFYDFAKANGFITNEKMEDGGGHQMAHIEYPGLPTDYVMEMVHRFYDEYYFRPKAAFRVVWKAIVNRDVPRLYVEAKSFLKLRAQRNRMVKEARSRQSRSAGAGERRRVAADYAVRCEGRRASRPPFFSFAEGIARTHGATSTLAASNADPGLVALCAPLGDTACRAA